jgi:DNA polymerase III epsilon subunit family exonuclease
VELTSAEITIPPKEVKILLKYFPRGVVALDLETTGLSPLIDEIIEISAVKITCRGISFFSTLVKPTKPIPKITTDIHGITDKMVENSPAIQDVLPQFVKFADGLPFVAHNAKFDMGFLFCSMYEHKINLTHSKVYCSLNMARKAFNKFKSFKLGNLTDALNIPLINHHRALDDAAACLSVFAKSLMEIDKNLSKKAQERAFNYAFIFNFDDFDPYTELTIPEHLELLKTKIVDQSPVEIKYQGGSHRSEFRPVKPVSIHPLPGGNVLYAHCLLSNLYKSFSLKKIKEVRELTTETKKRLKKG